LPKMLSKVSVLVLFASKVAAESGSGVSDDDWQQGAACYGFGGGHGVWKCGTSAAFCTEIGGVARYLPDYRSSYSGGCMCEAGCTDESAIMPGFTKPNSHDGFACYDTTSHTIRCGVSKDDCDGVSYPPATVGSDGCCYCDANCDHSAETADSCTYREEVPSPTPPPSPPSPPPSPSFPPLVGGSFSTVTVAFTVDGDVADWEDGRKASAVARKMALECAVHEDDITVTFEAGSVKVTAVVKTDDPAKVMGILEPAFADVDSAKSFLGSGVLGYRGTVESIDQAPTEGYEGMSTGALIGIIVGAIVGVVVIGAIVMMMMKKKEPTKGSA